MSDNHRANGRGRRDPRAVALIRELYDHQDRAPIDRAALVERLDVLGPWLDRYPNDDYHVGAALLPLLRRYIAVADPSLHRTLTVLCARLPIPC
jgi:hypothetical protein